MAMNHEIQRPISKDPDGYENDQGKKDVQRDHG